MPFQRRAVPSAQGAQDSSSEPPGQGQGSAQETAASTAPKGLQSLLAKHGNDPLKVAEVLYGENYELRKERRDYEALGAPSDIATKLRQGELERVAGKAGYNATVLARLDQMDGGKLTYEVRQETVDGAQTERVYVKDSTDDSAKEQALGDYAAAKWGEFLPSLTPQVASQGQSGNGVRFPAQGTGGSAAPVNTKTVAENTLNKAYASRK